MWLVAARSSFNISTREEHEDTLLHETLLCLKGLCTTDLALAKLREIESTLFPALLGMLFDPEHKGPCEFTTRGVIINLLFAHLTAATKDSPSLPARAQTILGYLQDQLPAEERKHAFMMGMHQSRPYKVWCKEVVNVTKEVFWIFLHHLNVVPLPSDGSETIDSVEEGKKAKLLPTELSLSSGEYLSSFYPQPRPPVPAAPYVGGVEWDATNYLASHLDLLNGLLSALPTRAQRNELRAELQASGWEKIMGGMLRTCKEKFYGAVHDGLRTWVAAAVADGWDARDVRYGIKEEPKSPVKRSASPAKKTAPAPKLDLPKLDLSKTAAIVARNGDDFDWLG